MKTSVKTLSILGVGMAVGIALSVGQGVFAERTGKSSMSALPLEDLRTFTDVLEKIKMGYVEPVEDKQLLENAVRGMLSGLDPHSAYLDPDGFKDLQVNTSGEFGGLGIEVGMEDGFVKVISPIDDTPAQKAGIKAGDLIIRIDETPVKGLTLNEAVGKMRGAPGTDIILTVVREGTEGTLKFTITRAVIKVSSVKGRLLETGFGYVRVSQFQANTGENLIQHVSKLKEENKSALKGLILDLRNNPGGVLQAAVAVSDAFIEQGLIVYTDGRLSDSHSKFNATGGDVLKGAPLIVLINGGSASASEIVAGALQDQKRAIVMGSKSFGKGSVQTILPMNNGGALKLTTARYFTPAGRSIQAEGITPDIVLENLKVAQADKPGFDPIKESDLSGHLENSNKPANGSPANSPVVPPESNKEKSSDKSKETGDNAAKKDGTPESLANTDYQLYEALNLLKGLTIAKNRGVM